MSEMIDPLTIKKKALFGAITLTSRTLLLQIVTFVATFLLTVLLKPEIFGIFFVVSAAVSFLNYFADIGLAAALVQKKEAITEDDLKTTFTIQLILVSIVVTIFLFFSTSIASFYNLNSEGLLLLRVLLISFFLSSFKTIPTIILERKLEFNKFVIPQIVENLFFYISVVLFAWLGLGISSFTIGVILRAISGLLTIYLLVPWKPKFGIEKSSARQLLRFGVPFQLNSFLALVKDDLLTLFLGKALGFTQVGYIGWAKKWSETPLRLIMDNINKVSFPAFARLQYDKAYLRKTVEKAIFFLILFTFPATFLGIILIKPLVSIIPKYQKWEPAILSFYFFSLSVLFASISSLLINMIQAVGKVKTTFRLMVLWTILTWLFIPLAIKIIGFNGVAFSIFLISLTSIVTVLIAKKLVPFNFLEASLKPTFISISSALVMFSVSKLYYNPDIYQIILILTSGFLSYILMIYLLVREELKNFISQIRASRIS